MQTDTSIVATHPSTPSARTGWAVLDVHGASDPGARRARNEDAFLVTADPGGYLLALADGIGGHCGGEVASELAVRAVARHVRTGMREAPLHRDMSEELRIAFGRAQTVVRAYAAGHPELARMGTTLTACYVSWPMLHVAHVGDSRCYLLRGGRLRRLTTDHTIGWQLFEEGILTEEDLERSPLGNVLWNAVGGADDTLETDVHSERLEPQDTLLLCSDGLSNEIPDGDVEQILLRNGSAAAKSEQLVAAAKYAGGSDNITVVVAEVVAGVGGA
jgi:protein phosphatase